jgi:hypothetical protein
MNHPYKEYEKTELWLKLEKALNDLTENKDIEITTSPEYVIGYLCKSLKPVITSAGEAGEEKGV